MATNNLAKKLKETRIFWVERIATLSSSPKMDFPAQCQLLKQELESAISKNDSLNLIQHLRLCGAIPEAFERSSSSEKLYAKYTDILIHLAFKRLGMESSVIAERGDSADVECKCKEYSFVADAKAFRLSRTAKNQKDFKIQQLDGWKKENDYAILVAPIYQMPRLKSQIYEQAIRLNICILSYSHLSILVQYSKICNDNFGIQVLSNIFSNITKMTPSQLAVDYWKTVNASMINETSQNSSFLKIWNTEAKETEMALNIAKEETSKYLNTESDEIDKLAHQEALEEIRKLRAIDAKLAKVNLLVTNDFLEIS